MSLGSISTIKPITSILNEKKIDDSSKNTDNVKFLDYLKNAMDNTNNLILDSEKISEDFAVGKTDNIHEVLISIEKADIALQFTMQVRNKILDAYNEIMRMQI